MQNMGTAFAFGAVVTTFLLSSGACTYVQAEKAKPGLWFELVDELPPGVIVGVRYGTPLPTDKFVAVEEPREWIQAGPECQSLPPYSVVGIAKGFNPPINCDRVDHPWFYVSQLRDGGDTPIGTMIGWNGPFMPLDRIDPSLHWGRAVINGPTRWYMRKNTGQDSFRQREESAE